MNRKTIKNYIYTVICQLTYAIVPIITIPYKTKVFSPENIGIYSYIFTVSSYIILIGSIGISLYGQREIAYVKDDKKERSKKLYELVILKTIILSSITLIFYLTIGLKSIYRNYYIILLIQILINILDVSWFMQGIEEFKGISIINSISKILNVILLFTIIKTNNDLLKYIILTVVFSVIPSIMIFILSRKYTEKVKIKELEIFKHLKKCLILFLPQVFMQICTVFDKIMLGNMQSQISEVGYYEYADKIIQIAISIIGAITTVMIPVISYQFKKQKTKELKKNIHDLTNIVICLSLPIALGILAVSNNLTTLFFPEEYSKINILIKILSLSIFPIAFMGIGEQYLICTKQEAKFTKIIGIGTCANLILNTILINKYESIGVAAATIIAEVLIVIIEIPIIGKLIKIKETLKNTFKYLFTSIIMFIIVYQIGTINNSLPILIIQIITGISIYGIMLLITKDNLVKKILKKDQRYS